MLIGLYGNYGAGNAGDELVGLGLARAIDDAVRLRTQKPRILLFAHRPQLARPWWPDALIYRTLPTGIRSLFTAWLPSVLALISCDIVFVGGGTLLTGSSSQKFPGAMLLWRWQFALLRMLCRRVVFIGQGFGPFATPTQLQQARAAVAGHPVLVRDAQSQRNIPGSTLAPDPIFLLDPGATYAPRNDGVFHIAVSVRSWGRDTPNMLRRTAQTIMAASAAAAPRPVQVHGVPMQHPLESDYPALKQLGDILGGRVPYSIMEEDKWSEKTIREAIARADLVIGMRLHANLLAITHRRALLALDYQGKTTAVLDNLGLGHRCLDLRNDLTRNDELRIHSIVQRNDTDVWQAFYRSRILSHAYTGFLSTIIAQVTNTKER